MITPPLYTGTLHDQPLRFFKAPRPGPHLVWHSVDDLHRCLTMPRDLRRHYRQSLQRDYGKDIATVATEGGIEIIAPHWMAQGLISSMRGFGYGTLDTEVLYAKEAVKAWNAQAGDLPPGASFELMAAAFRNTNGIGP